MATLLIIEDNRTLAIALSAAAEGCGLQTQMAPTLARARDALNNHTFDGILLDIGLPDGHGLELVEQWAWAQKPEIAVITAHGEIENAISARKLGIGHFFDKPINFEELQAFFKSLSLIPSNQSNQPQQPVQQNTTAIAHTSQLVGASASMRPVFRQISNACASNQPVVISGAAGTGKTHVALLIQQSSKNQSPPPILQASSYLTEEPLMDALHKAQGKPLIIESVTTLPLPLQTLMVQTMDDMGDEAPRLIVTVGEEGLLSHVEDEQFLHELYLRLHILEVCLPPLKSRLEDLPEIAIRFINELDQHSKAQLDQAVIETLMRHDWPGNLRELRNTIQHALITSAGASNIIRSHIPAQLTAPNQHRKIHEDEFLYSLQSWINQQLTEQQDYKQISTKLEGHLLQILLDRFDGKPSHLAAALSINRSTLRKKLNASSKDLS